MIIYKQPLYTSFQNDLKHYIKMDMQVLKILVIILVTPYASTELLSGKLPSTKEETQLPSTEEETPLITKRRLCIQLTSVSSSVTPLASFTLPDQHRCMMKCAHNKECSAFNYKSSSKICTLVPSVNIIEDLAPQNQYLKLATCASLVPVPAPTPVMKLPDKGHSKG